MSLSADWKSEVALVSGECACPGAFIAYRVFLERGLSQGPDGRGRDGPRLSHNDEGDEDADDDARHLGSNGALAVAQCRHDVIKSLSLSLSVSLSHSFTRSITLSLARH